VRERVFTQVMTATPTAPSHTATAQSSQAAATGLAAPANQVRMAAAFTIGFGLMMALGSHEATDAPLRWFADLLFWPLGDDVVFTQETRLLAAILGGVMVGFGVVFWMLTDALADTNPALLRRLVLVTLGSWFIIDSAGSIASGAWLNVIGNLGFVAIYIVPAMRLR